MTKPRARIYDDFLPGPLLRLVLSRREHPDGQRHNLSETVRAGRRVPVYPWPKMQVGDFFEVPIGDRSERAMRVSFNQAAARLDAEIAVRVIKNNKGQHCFRVTVVLFGIKDYLATVAKSGIPVPPRSDGRWRDRKNKWAKSVKSKPRPVNTHTPKEEEAAPTPSPTMFEMGMQMPGENTTKAMFAPEVKLTREEVLRRAMEQSR